jgi:hypothetical protein
MLVINLEGLGMNSSWARLINGLTIRNNGAEKKVKSLVKNIKVEILAEKFK